jgi:hypothetical protein
MAVGEGVEEDTSRDMGLMEGFASWPGRRNHPLGGRILSEVPLEIGTYACTVRPCRFSTEPRTLDIYHLP